MCTNNNCIMSIFNIYLIDDNKDIKKILSKINVDTNVLDFFDNHEISVPIYALNIHLATAPEMFAPSSENELDAPPDFLNTQNSMVGKDINHDTSDSEASEEGEEGSDANSNDSCVSKETKEIANNVEIPPKRSHPIKSIIDD